MIKEERVPQRPGGVWGESFSLEIKNNAVFPCFFLWPVLNLTEIPVAPPTTAASSVEEPEGELSLSCLCYFCSFWSGSGD